MRITCHPFRGIADIHRITDLVTSMPISDRHVLDLPWRLSSPAISEGRDAAFWEDADGRVVGFAAWQYYWAVLDFFILPGPQQQEVEKELFAWADGRFREQDEERGKPLIYWTEYRDDDLKRRQLIEAQGFLFYEEDHYVLLQHHLIDLPPVPPLPEGFTLRTLAGEQEAAAYSEVHRAAFESTSMTPMWRACTLQMPQYHSELDLVIVTPNNTFAGFCVGWFVPERHLAQVEPIGVHSHFQQLGLSRILLLEMLHLFKKYGASNAFVETNLERTPARQAYTAVGFQQIHTIRHKGKWMSQPSE